MEAKSPTNVMELKSYVGLLNYYGKFLPSLVTTLHPLHDLLQKGIKTLKVDGGVQESIC